MLVAALVALACALALPTVAAAESFEVNSTGDETDAVPGDEFCLTSGGDCTLRAALKESNTLDGEDTIGFAEPPFDGGPGATISLGSSLPTIEGIVSIEGECVVANVLRPCVGVDGPNASEPALSVENTEFVQVFGLAITGAETGIEVTDTTKFKALSNWLGVGLDGSAGGNGTGILLGPGSKNSQIGNEGVAGNVFANNTADGLDLHGASGVRVLGGYFGVKPDGVTPAPNGGDGIEAVSEGGFEAIGNTIGTQLDSAAVATPACDGGCNLISASGSSGLDLEGDGGGESAAAGTTVAGNYVGLDANGTAAIPNALDGIRVGQAAGTSIGGPRTSEANRLAGGGAAVSAGPGANDLVVRGNSIGLGADGGSLAAPGAGIVVDSEGLSGAPAEAVVAGNQIRMNGGVAIDHHGLGGWLAGNEISGAATGIRVSGENEGHGNLVEGNAIAGSAVNGVLLENGRNEVFGNQVLDSGGAGIRIEGAGLFFGFGVSRNLIGGDAGTDENLIAGSGAAAIEISNPEVATNEVGRNRGFANAGLFIDLVAASPSGKKGPNEGIKPPAFGDTTQFEAAGSGALPGARIRVFRKASAEAGEIESFLGEAIANEDGEWNVAYATSIPGNTIVAATQTSPVGGTSELAVTAASPEPAAQACCGPPPVEVQPIPQTKIFKGPKGKKFVKATVAFKFKASVDGSTFQCRLDGKPFRKCHSPQVYTGLAPGKHRFEVRAANAAGQVDKTPAKLKFTVLP